MGIPPERENNRATTVYVSNLWRGLKELDILEKFEQYGPVERVFIVLDPITK